MKDFLKPLEEIKQVEVPSHLIFQIQERLKMDLSNRISMKLVYSMAASFFILLSINALILIKQNRLSKAEITIAQAFQLLPDNNLYK